MQFWPIFIKRKAPFGLQPEIYDSYAFFPFLENRKQFMWFKQMNRGGHVTIKEHKANS